MKTTSKQNFAEVLKRRVLSMDIAPGELSGDRRRQSTRRGRTVQDLPQRHDAGTVRWSRDRARR